MYDLNNSSTRQLLASIQPDTNPILPTIAARIQHDAIRERIRFTSRDGRDMIFISIDDGENLEDCLLEHVLHSFADFRALCNLSALIFLTYRSRSIPDSVLGVAIVTSNVQISQQTSSSPFPANPPNHIPGLRRFFS